MNAEREWPVSFRRNGYSNALTASIPAEVGRALIEQSLWKATLSITEDGLLLRPQIADDPRPLAPPPTKPKLEIPDWGSS